MISSDNGVYLTDLCCADLLHRCGDPNYHLTPSVGSTLALLVAGYTLLDFLLQVMLWRSLVCIV